MPCLAAQPRDSGLTSSTTARTSPSACMPGLRFTSESTDRALNREETYSQCGDEIFGTMLVEDKSGPSSQRNAALLHGHFETAPLALTHGLTAPLIRTYLPIVRASPPCLQHWPPSGATTRYGTGMSR